jgi:hypothetical protein
MFRVETTTSQLVDKTLISGHIFDTEKPLMITFSPAGEVLTSDDIQHGKNAWGYDYFKKPNQRISIFSC